MGTVFFFDPEKNELKSKVYVNVKLRVPSSNVQWTAKRTVVMTGPCNDLTVSRVGVPPTKAYLHNSILFFWVVSPAIFEIKLAQLL